MPQADTPKVLLVDDDPIVLRVYREGLAHHGFHVETAEDGLVAAKALRASKYQAVVLDLMMPKMSGPDVLKFIRSQPDLAALPVIVFSNAFMGDLATEAAAAGAQTALLKVSCTPSALAGVIRGLLQKTGPNVVGARPAMPHPQVSPPVQAPKSAAPPPPRSQPVPPPPEPPPAPLPPEPEAADEKFKIRARRDLLQHAEATCAELRGQFQAFTNARNDTERELRLQTLYRRVHFVASEAGLAGCPDLAQMASVFEAFLFELLGKLSRLGPSAQRTIASTIDFLGFLFAKASQPAAATPLSAQALVVDDDPLANRMAVSALRHAQLQAQSAEDPVLALQCLQETRFDLVLLDIEMPGMDGYELCKKLRKLPGYEKTPVIYVTIHSDFESRQKSLLSGGDDLISKPVFPMELAVKGVACLLRKKLTA